MQLLIENNADIEAQGRNGFTALQLAAVRGYESTVRLLIAKGADVNARGGRHRSVLETAMQKKPHRDDETRTSIIALLKEHGATLEGNGTPSRHSTPESSRKWREVTVRKAHSVYSSFRRTFFLKKMGLVGLNRTLQFAH